MAKLRLAMYKSGNKELSPWLKSFAKGFKLHGGEVVERTVPTAIEDLCALEQVDIHVFWGMRNKEPIYQHCINTGQIPICLERGYTEDRYDFTSINFWGLNGESQLVVPNNDSSRCLLHKWEIKEKARKHDKIVIIGQKAGDKSLKGVCCYDWAERQIACFAKLGLYDKLVFKPHPLETFGNIRKLGIPLYMEDMQTALSEAIKVVTLSSTSAVDAWLNSVPATSASPISMIHRYQSRVNESFHYMTEWLNDLSYRQFSREEYKSGLVWELYGEQMLNAKPDKELIFRDVGNLEALQIHDINTRVNY